jgi:hypothetical protein
MKLAAFALWLGLVSIGGFSMGQQWRGAPGA